MSAVEADLGATGVGEPDLLGGDGTSYPHMVEGGVARDPHDPGGEGDLSLLVLLDRFHQLGEDVLGDVLGLMMIFDEAGDIALDIRCVADIEKVQSL